MATRNFRIDPSYFFVFYFSVHTSTEPTFFEHSAGYRSHQLGYFSANRTISWLSYLPVERGSFFPAEYLLRRRRVRSLRARRPGGSLCRSRLRGGWDSA